MGLVKHYTTQDGIRSVIGGKESTVDEEQQCTGLVPSQLSSVRLLLANANDEQLGPHPFLNCN